MFSLHQHQTKIAAVNLRAEKHGDENVPAVDVKFETTVHSRALDAFDPALRPLLFRKAEIGEQPSLLEGDDLIGLRLPQLKTLSWDEDFPGYSAVTDVGGLNLQVELSKFKFDANEGGAVKITFNATAHPDPDSVASLYELIQETVELTLTPPKGAPQHAGDQADAFEEAEED